MRLTVAQSEKLSLQKPLNESLSLNISKEAHADYFASLIQESRTINRIVAVAAYACVPPI